jgi:hypothetical protein
VLEDNGVKVHRLPAGLPMARSVGNWVNVAGNRMIYFQVGGTAYVPGRNDGLDDAAKEVLLRTSTINRVVTVPNVGALEDGGGLLGCITNHGCLP